MTNSTLTIVALGASAGGLEALQGFFAAMPADRRLAFVVVTHLQPQHESRMAEVLGRATSMPVSEAQDGERVEASHVYVIPPNRLMGIRAGNLYLEPAVARPAIPHPIDYFMSALAMDKQAHCAGIVFSGTEHDGTEGLTGIKAAGGLAIVQDPASAQFPGMPRSAIAADVVDQVLPVDRMGPALIEHVGQTQDDVAADVAPRAPSATRDVAPSDQLSEILNLVHKRSSRDFRWYRPAMLLRRVRRRMALKSIGDIADYAAVLNDSEDEVQALVKDFLISVTEFFRQPDAWRVLEDKVISRLVDDHIASGTAVRVWTPGCATGEESYSIAMLLLERLGDRHGGAPVTVFASDLDTDALAVARAGKYPESIADAVGPERLARFFDKEGDQYVVRKSLREMVLFTPHDLLRDPPFSKLDLIICRNLLIYFDPAQQSRVAEVFHFALNPDGVLFLGNSETLGAPAQLFEPLSRTHRIFRRVGSMSHLPRLFEGQWTGPTGYLAPAEPPRRGNLPDAAELVRQQLGGRAVAAAVLINRDYRVLYFHGEIARFLQPAGEPAWDLLTLLRHGLRSRVRGALQRAIGSEQAAEVRAHVSHDGHPALVSIRVEPVADFPVSGLLVVCFDEPALSAAVPTDDEAGEHALLQAELHRLRSELAAAEQDGENTTAELRVANEEAMSLNEELQSSNEELQTSKEELQSMNEELVSLNSELEDKVGQLERALGDLDNLMENTRVATFFLDRDLRIRRYTQESARLFRVIPSDEGRPLRDITSAISDPTLFDDAKAVLEGADSREAEVATVKGGFFLRRVLPYRKADESVEGVVVTFTNVTAMRAAAQEARRLAAVLNDSNDSVIVYDFSGRILFWNRGAEVAYGYSQHEALGLNFRQLEPQEREGHAFDLASSLRHASSAGPITARRVTRSGKVLDVSATVSALRDETGNAYAVVTTERDVTEKLRQESELRFRVMADDIPTLLRIEDETGQAKFLNRAWLEFTGESAAEALLADGWLRYIHPDDLPGYVSDRRAARDNRCRFDGDLRLRRADGSYRWMRTTSVARTDAGDRLEGYVSLSVDIEERKRAEEAVAQDAQRKDEFLAMLAHELRNPLAPIANAVTVIERVSVTDPKIVWATAVIARQTQQLARLVDDLMDVARIASGKVALHRELIELPLLVERARDASQPMIDARSQRLSITVPRETLYIEGDLVRLTQVLANLLNNASKYSEPGGEIGLTVSSTGNDVTIRVTDHGLGISPEMLPRVFDLFAQEDKSLDRAQGGLGIGLTLVDRLVRAHGGSVEPHSQGLGRGSEFVVRLRAYRPPQLQRTEPPADVPLRATVSRRILVVDDNADAAESMAVLLEQAGLAVRTAKDGQEAIAAVASFEPDVVMLDIGLPGISGYDVARHLRGQQATAGVLLVAITGYGQAEDIERAKAAGFDHHLVKPVSFDRLLGLIAPVSGARTVPTSPTDAAPT